MYGVLDDAFGCPDCDVVAVVSLHGASFLILCHTTALRAHALIAGSYLLSDAQRSAGCVASYCLVSPDLILRRVEVRFVPPSSSVIFHPADTYMIVDDCIIGRDKRGSLK